jgi:CRISPR-associated endonuclease/helicase Cas3
MLYSFRLKSHPNKLLKNHLENVAKLSRDIINSKYIKNKELFSTIGYLIGASHDFGKATTFFQKILNNDEKTKYANHGFLSSLFGYYIIKNYLKKIEKLEEFWYMPVIAWVVINEHHGDIKDVGRADGEIFKLDDEEEIDTVKKQIEDIINNSIEEVNIIYKELFEEKEKIKGLELQEFINIFNSKEAINEFIKGIRRDALKISRENDIRYYFIVLFFYSVLLDADKLDASETQIPKRIEIPENIIDNYKKIKFKRNKNIDKVREDAYKEVIGSIHNLDLTDERILSINLPTGIGKTLTGLSFALHLREKIKKEFGFTPRIIYSLPYLSIIDQNSEVIEDVFKTVGGYTEIPSNLFLKHHHLADVEYREEKDNELNIIGDINKSLLLTEGWHSEIVITTFVQFFHSLVTNRNRAARKFHNMINSIILLDEVQSIPHKYWLLIREILQYMAKDLNCWIILMTATEPLIFGKNEIKELVKNREGYFNLFDRVEYNFDLKEKNFEEFKEELLNQIEENEDKNIMVVVNTIDSCKELFTYLKEKFCRKYNLDAEKYIDNDGICNLPKLEIINISTHVLPDFRLRRINRIKNKGKRKIIITTQLIEAGVDISVDIIYRDFAPLDCIIQTAGRCNRNGEKRKGSVNIVLLKDENNKPFYSYIYDSMLIDITKEVIKKIGKNTSEKEFTIRAADEYYDRIIERGSKEDSRRIVESLKELNFSRISKFSLIEEKLPTVSIFVEIDKRAQETRRKIEKILTEKKRFEKRKELIKIRKDLNLYTISINLSTGVEEKIVDLPLIGDVQDFRYIPEGELGKWYKLDIGFQLREGGGGFIV